MPLEPTPLFQLAEIEDLYMRRFQAMLEPHLQGLYPPVEVRTRLGAHLLWAADVDLWPRVEMILDAALSPRERAGASMRLFREARDEVKRLGTRSNVGLQHRLTLLDPAFDKWKTDLLPTNRDFAKLVCDLGALGRTNPTTEREVDNAQRQLKEAATHFCRFEGEKLHQLMEVGWGVVDRLGDEFDGSRRRAIGLVSAVIALEPDAERIEQINRASQDEEGEELGLIRAVHYFADRYQRLETGRDRTRIAHELKKYLAHPRSDFGRVKLVEVQRVLSEISVQGVGGKGSRGAAWGYAVFMAHATQVPAERFDEEVSRLKKRLSRGHDPDLRSRKK